MNVFRLWPITLLLLAAGYSAESRVLSEEELSERMIIFGEGFLLEVLDGPVIEDPPRWIGRESGEYVYRFVAGSADGAQIQTERHVPDPDNPDDAWERHVGESLVETFLRTEEREVVIVEEADHRHGFRMEIEPGIHWPANIKPGDEWQVDAKLVVYDLESGELFKNGRLTSTIAYEGSFRIRTPAGDFDTVLLREDFILHIGPLKAEDDRFLFFAKDLGLVAEIEAIRASALLLFHIKEDSAKVLQSYRVDDQN